MYRRSHENFFLHVECIIHYNVLSILFKHVSQQVKVSAAEELVGETSKESCSKRNSSKDYYIWDDTGSDVGSENGCGSNDGEENTEDNWELPGEISESDSEFEEANDGHKKREKYVR